MSGLERLEQIKAWAQMVWDNGRPQSMLDVLALVATVEQFMAFAQTIADLHAPQGKARRCWKCGLDGDCCHERHGALRVLALPLLEVK